MKKTFYLLCLAVLPFSACNKGGEAPPAPQTQVVANPKVTADNYNLINVGMTLAQIIAILGNSTTGSGNSGSYSWSADTSNTIVITLVFVNGSLQTKSQTGVVSTYSTGGSTTGGSTTGGSSGSNGSGCPATYNGRTVYTGPRGGCYYINSSGNKVYI